MKTQAKKIKLVILDVDGVMTDGSLFYDDNGNEYKAFNSKDGLGMRMLQDGGIDIALLTGRKSQLVIHRAENLRIPPQLVFQGYRDKRPAYNDIKKQTHYSDSEIAYVGDDLVDLPVMIQVGFSIAVNNAHPYVQQHADWVTQAQGGQGAVREVCEYILDAQNKLESMLSALLK